MEYSSSHLASLRREISSLRDLNVRYSQQAKHGPIEQAAADVRSDRLVQIKLELSNMRDCPPDPEIWWDKVRKPVRAA